MNEDLLIRTERRWLPRTIDCVLTLLAWVAFIYLFLNGFISVLQHKPSAQEHRHFGLLFATVSTLASYLIIGLVNALVLMTWAKYNQVRRRVERRSRIPALTCEQMRDSFRLPEELQQLLRTHQICSIHNDDEGHIVGAVVGSVYAEEQENPVPAAGDGTSVTSQTDQSLSPVGIGTTA